MLSVQLTIGPILYNFLGKSPRISIYLLAVNMLIKCSCLFCKFVQVYDYCLIYLKFTISF